MRWIESCTISWPVIVVSYRCTVFTICNINHKFLTPGNLAENPKLQLFILIDFGFDKKSVIYVNWKREWFGTLYYFRVLWCVVVIVAVTLFVSQVGQRMAVYFLYKTHVDVQVKYVETVDFPSVTICNQNNYRSVMIQYLEWNDDHIEFM